MLSDSNALVFENYLFSKYQFGIVFFLFTCKMIFNFHDFCLNMSCCNRCGKASPRDGEAWKVWSCSQCPCCTCTQGLTGFLAALLASLPRRIVVAIAQKSLWWWEVRILRRWRYDSKQNQLTAVGWGFANGAEGAEETTAHLSLWMCAEMHFFYACSLTALLVRTKSFLYYTEYVSVQL